METALFRKKLLFIIGFHAIINPLILYSCHSQYTILEFDRAGLILGIGIFINICSFIYILTFSGKRIAAFNPSYSKLRIGFILSSWFSPLAGSLGLVALSFPRQKWTTFSLHALPFIFLFSFLTPIYIAIKNLRNPNYQTNQVSSAIISVDPFFSYAFGLYQEKKLTEKIKKDYESDPLRKCPTSDCIINEVKSNPSLANLSPSGIIFMVATDTEIQYLVHKKKIGDEAIVYSLPFSLEYLKRQFFWKDVLENATTPVLFAPYGTMTWLNGGYQYYALEIIHMMMIFNCYDVSSQKLFRIASKSKERMSSRMPSTGDDGSALVDSALIQIRGIQEKVNATKLGKFLRH